MKKLTTAILLITLIAGFSSCRKEVIGEGPITTETRPVTNFTSIDLRMNGNVYFSQEANWKVEVTAKESIHSILETFVVNNSLVIKYKNGKTYDEDASIRINISGPSVSGFMLNTSGNIICTNDIMTSNLFLRTSGSGDIVLQKVIANNIDAESTVSGRITAAAGVVVNEKLKTNGSGKIDLSAIAANNVSARTIGSGDIKVKVSDHLDATIDGSGSVYFRGYPQVSTHIHGSGAVIRF
jgi:Putative auto-transporter adhesin, head GIN domain